MKQKEYYQIGRLALLAGYVLLMLNAIFDPWMPLNDSFMSSGGIYSILNCWAFLIPAGYLTIGIAMHRKADIVCAVLALLCSVFAFSERLPGKENVTMQMIGFLFGWISLANHENGLVFLIIAMLYTCAVAIAAIRLFRNRRFRKLSVTLAVVTLTLWLFYVLGFKGTEDEGSLLAPLRNLILRLRGEESVDVTDEIMAIARGMYITLTCLAAACCVTETISDRKTPEAMR